VTVRREGIAVTGGPRPTSVPVASGLPLPHPPAVPPEVAPVAGRMARQAVAAAIAGDGTALARW
jgi:hypothetical protein